MTPEIFVIIIIAMFCLFGVPDDTEVNKPAPTKETVEIWYDEHETFEVDNEPITIIVGEDDEIEWIDEE